ncbi:hypothetical protein PPYR_05623 [Photinus pyralis]|uniref:SLC41A/MgtE integral membrane domain-containing protein n=1 Tax=Photinus pyralis TaxID=7054 RepID=A0A1Y1KUC4_PHOPY|nr:solute carrier family 41 member 1-like isoform X2 [Photinus pyralis]XP_031335369.1 solute carrier family 41 member 1-like isoform X2 [Photinus pyralis]KAB0801269.1 hypothetical protein PPYR_05623 [Photinus pyralis]
MNKLNQNRISEKSSGFSSNVTDPSSSTTNDGIRKLSQTLIETSTCEENEIQMQETYFSVAIQVFIPFLIAGFGMVFAGLVLDRIQHLPVFEEITELVILTPPLLGLKGNLEMTLASRLSTHANLGRMDSFKQKWNMITANLMLTQCQAIVVGLLGSLVAVIMGGIRSNEVELAHVLLICASSLLTVSLASFVLGLVTSGAVVLSRLCHINPDNVATPIAASLGDITSLALLSWVSTALYDCIGKRDWVAPFIIVGYITVIPCWVWVAKHNVRTREVLYHGWTPILGAMLISSMGGLILDIMVSKFEGIARFQPLMNGVGGNLVAVHASRISTSLHKEQELGLCSSSLKTEEESIIFISPVSGFCGKEAHSRTARVLMTMVVPGHLIFLYTIVHIKGGNTSLSTIFVLAYLCAAVVQVATLLYVAYIMIHWMWKRKIDPDNSAIPYLTSMGDLLGISLLALAFQFLHLVIGNDSQLGD